MTTQINPYIVFNGNCREAMTFYQQCLGGELTLNAVGESPMADQWPAEAQKNILHAMLINNGIVLLGSDMGEPGTKFSGHHAVVLSISCSSEEEINRFYNKLLEGGVQTRHLHDFLQERWVPLLISLDMIGCFIMITQADK